MNEQKEPFGYFRVEPFGWVDCGENDEGAVVLYDQETVNALQERCDELLKQRDELLAALEAVQDVANQSSGIAGWHLNGDVASWDELLPEVAEAMASARRMAMKEVSEEIERLAIKPIIHKDAQRERAEKNGEAKK